MPVRHALIEHGNFTQVLVCNAGHVKNVPGRKTGLRAIYTACEADAAYAALADFSGPPLGKKYPAAVAVRERAWTQCHSA
jgi:transposase-like protein